MPRNMMEVQSFMGRERLASFATVSSEGKPHVVPVFFTYESGKVYIQTDRESAKVQNILNNNNVAIAVYSEEEAVIIRGKGRVVDRSDEFVWRTRDHINKYQLRLDKNGQDSLGIPLFDEKTRCIVEVVGKKTIFW